MNRRRIEVRAVCGGPTRGRWIWDSTAYFGERDAVRTLLTAGLLTLSCAVLLLAQDSAKRTGEEGRLLALESAWNHAEQSKDAAALNQLLADSFAYVDYDGKLMNKKEFLASTVNGEVQNEQINNEGMTIQIYGDAAVVNGAYRDKGLEKGKPFS